MPSKFAPTGRAGRPGSRCARLERRRRRRSALLGERRVAASRLHPGKIGKNRHALARPAFRFPAQAHHRLFLGLSRDAVLLWELWRAVTAFAPPPIRPRQQISSPPARREPAPRPSSSTSSIRPCRPGGIPLLKKRAVLGLLEGDDRSAFSKSATTAWRRHSVQPSVRAFIARSCWTADPGHGADVAGAALQRETSRSRLPDGPFCRRQS